MSVSSDFAVPQRRGRVRVKICGITNPADAEAAIEAGADALGFNGFRGSKRYLDLEAASDWMTQLPPFVMRTVVVVNPSEEEVKRLLDLPGVDLIQFHGDESPEFCNRFRKYGFVKAVAARNRASLQECQQYETRSILLDAYVPGAYGGTGQLIDLDLAGAFVAENPSLRVILSGGLNVANVAEAVCHVRPWGVDVASGVEAAPGKKDAALMRDFIAAVQSTS